MADLIQTPADVRAISGSSTQWKIAGDNAIKSGMPVYEDPADKKMKMAQANAQATATAYGIALTNADLDDQILVLRSGDIELGAVLAIGELYVVSAAAAGAIAPHSDLVATNWPFQLGYAKSTSVITVALIGAGVAKA